MASSTVPYLPTHLSGLLNGCQREEDWLTVVSLPDTYLHTYTYIEPVGWCLFAELNTVLGARKRHKIKTLIEIIFTLWKAAQSQELNFFLHLASWNCGVLAWKWFLKHYQICTSQLLLCVKAEEGGLRAFDRWIWIGNVVDSRWQRLGFLI